ncbi:MAG: substrate-binding domain-containing protein [Rhodocyclaceae bacterium]|nr:substrate-binding domain-containing protein [Rhodocyclaceae bacterium]
MNPRKSIAIALLMSAAIAAPAWAQTLNISGGTTPYSEVIEPNLATIKKATGVDIKFNGNGTGKGMFELLEGKVTVAAVGDTLGESIKAAKKAAEAAGRDVKVPDNLFFTKIGTDELVVIVHKSNPISALTRNQAKDIATGKVVNWKDVGGPDLPIQVITTEPSLAPGQFFKRAIMGGADYVKTAKESTSPKDTIALVSKDKGGFGMAANTHMKTGAGEAKAIKTTAMIRPLGLVTVGEPTGDAAKVAAFLKK